MKPFAGFRAAHRMLLESVIPGGRRMLRTPKALPPAPRFALGALVVAGMFVLVVAGCRGEGPRATSPAPAATAATPTPTSASDWWKPGPGLSWQWQLTGRLNLDLYTDVVDIDLSVGRSVVDYYHQRGTRVICYMSVGSYENWRADKDAFPKEVIGKPYEGWSGEWWLDIRRIDLLGPIMQARLDQCAAKGFDAVEPDNLMVYTEDTGFPISYEANIRYARWLAEEAHRRGLAIGQKNGPQMVKDLVGLYDFAITEEAFYYDFAEDFLPYIEAGKAVFDAEYTDTDVDWEEACRRSRELQFSTILKNRELDAWVRFCDGS